MAEDTPQPEGGQLACWGRGRKVDTSSNLVY